MKAGLVTFYHIHHYGALLQAAATERAVERFGWDCEIIDYFVNQDNALFKRPTGLGSAAHDAHTALHYQALSERYRRFEKFSRDHLRISDRRYGRFDELAGGPLPYDLILSGSDQIWNPKIFPDGRFDPVFFGTFSQKRRIAYAPSFGVPTIPEGMQAELKGYLDGFSHLSARETQGSAIIRDIAGKDAPVVLDPTLLLTADGQVAGAEDANNTGARGNAMAVVSEKGDVQLVCGGALLNIGTASEYAGQVVSVYADKSGLKLNKISGGVGGDLLPKEGTLGGRKLADNVMLFDGGRQIALSELSQTGVNSGRVSYARTNWAGQVDLIVLNNGLAGDMIFGRAIVDSKYDPTTGKETDRTITIVCSDTEKYTVYSGNSVSTGAFVAASIKKSVNDRLMFTSFATMSKLSNVSSGAWIGKTAVNFGSRTYEVPSNVQCYNDDTGKWMTLDDAKAYGGTMNLYVYDGVVRIVEVKA